MRNFLRVSDLTPKEIGEVLDLAAVSDPPQCLAGKGAALLFEFPSARTRNASEMAVVELGGHPVSITAGEVDLDRRETVEDVARTLACFHALIAARVASHSTLDRMATALASAGVEVPVVNLLSDVEHPTQAIADLLTIRQEFGSIEGRKVAYIGDANNVCRSLAWACADAGASIAVAAPEGFGLSDEDLGHLRDFGAVVETTTVPAEAADAADVIYTDVWVSMGQENAAEKRAAFAGYTIDEAILGAAAKDAIVLHCLPAHRGEEISAAVIDGPASRVWRQAANRKHAMRGVIQFLFGGGR